MTTMIHSIALLGIDAFVVEIEADLSNGLPAFDLVGLPDAAVKEAKERVRAALKNSGFSLPPRKIVLNLAPGNIQKVGSQYDLPIALALLVARCKPAVTRWYSRRKPPTKPPSSRACRCCRRPALKRLSRTFWGRRRLRRSPTSRRLPMRAACLIFRS